MSKVGYAEAADDAGGEHVLGLIRTGRGWVPNIFRVLLFSPGVAEGWARLANSLRSSTTLEPRTRGLVILLVAHLKSSAYEWDYHSRAAPGLGIDERRLDLVRAWPERGDWVEEDWTLLTFVAASVGGTEVPAWCLDRLLRDHGQAWVVEVAATAAYYAAVAQFAHTLGLEGEDPSAG